MDQREQDAVIGKAHRELQENKLRLGALKKEAFDLGSELIQAGQALQQMPEYAKIFGFDGDPYVMGEKPLITVKRETFNAEKISRLLQDIRSTEKQIEQVSEIL